MKVVVLASLLALSFTAEALAVPQRGNALPAVSVRDLDGARHTERDLLGQWTVAFAMTDKDLEPNLRAWWAQVERRMPRRTRLLSFVALDLFALVPTATILTEARESAPRATWSTVWFCRDGSFAAQLGLPDSETPWVFVIDPTGRVRESIHGDVDAAGIARVLAALGDRHEAGASP